METPAIIANKPGPGIMSITKPAQTKVTPGIAIKVCRNGRGIERQKKCNLTLLENLKKENELFSSLSSGELLNSIS
jgi:hypothetical protein